MVRKQFVLATGFLSFLVFGSVGVGLSQEVKPAPSKTDVVGIREDQSVQTPVNQVLTPYGTQIDLAGMRPQAVAVSHSGKYLVASGKTSALVVIDITTNQIIQTVAMPGRGNEIDEDAQVSYTGLIFSSDDKYIYLSDVNGTIKVFELKSDGNVVRNRTIPLPPANAPRRKAEITSGIRLNSDNSKLYVCGNLSNQLLEIDLQSDKVTRTWDVGVAPYDLAIHDSKAYVSNWGGRRPDKDSTVGPAGRGTVVRVDSESFIASEGSVSVVDLEGRSQTKELVVGRHASGIAVSPLGKYVVCACAADDYLAVIDANSFTLARNLYTKAKPSDLFGAGPNALTFDDKSERLFVANGSQNAIAVIEFEEDELEESKIEGLIPVGWYPGAISLLPGESNDCSSLVVANIKGLPKIPKKERDSGVDAFNSHHYSGSLSIFQVPPSEELADLSEAVERNLRRTAIENALLPPRENQRAKAIPERIGEPSLIKHVVYVIKENRTYDQVFGALPQGRGNADLCIFGRKITPNQHKMVEQFVLLDNTYCAGILSADGHQWSTTAISTDYMEKSFAGFPRSYPDGMEDDDVDALAYSPAGFIWDNAKRAGITIRNYGEFMMPRVRYKDAARSGTPDFLACYRTWKGESDEVVFASEPGIESVREFSPTDYVGWEMSVPDQYRADFIINEVKEFDRQGKFPQLTIICLPNDHASGTRPGCPTPAACMADNDLAFGRIVDALSHTQFWPQMAIFGIEDDPQAGWDHISGYRTTAYVISPYAKRGEVISSRYNTTSLLRTIEQILGMPPMNQFDASADPMFDCFLDTANLTPFEAVPNLVPLDQMNPDPAAIKDPILRGDALVSMELNFAEVDRAPEDVLNRILWRAMKGTEVPYPAWAAGLDDDEDEEAE